MPQLVVIRHGQSTFNLENRFTGELDVPLTDLGKQEALAAGEKVKATQIIFDHVFTSTLSRAHQTLHIVLSQIDQLNIPISQDRALNERNYGDLQGLNKAETAKQYGEEKVVAWRRSYSVRPPGGESLQDTVNRVIPYYHAHIEPLLKANKNILIVAHGNSLRSLIMYLENISEQDIVHTEIATGAPRVYTFNQQMSVIEVKNL